MPAFDHDFSDFDTSVSPEEAYSDHFEPSEADFVGYHDEDDLRRQDEADFDAIFTRWEDESDLLHEF